MAKWTGVITNSGNSLLNAWVGEKTLRFDCAKAGTGTVEIASLMAQTDLVSKKQDAGILNAESVDGGIRMKLRVTASQEGYLLNQFGVWASVDGNTALIAIFQHESGVSVPSIDESPDFAFTFYALIMTSNIGTWTVSIDTSALVTMDDMNSAIAENAKQYLPLSGGKMAGNIDMQGKAISGLNEPKEDNQAVPKSYADNIAKIANSAKKTADSALPKSGGAMTGAINMNGQKIFGLNDPTNDTEVARKSYVDKMLSKSGGTMTGSIAMSGNQITGIGAPTDSTDAANKGYVDAAIGGALSLEEIEASDDLSGKIPNAAAAAKISKMAKIHHKIVTKKYSPSGSTTTVVSFSIDELAIPDDCSVLWAMCTSTGWSGIVPQGYSIEKDFISVTVYNIGSSRSDISLTVHILYADASAVIYD